MVHYKYNCLVEIKNDKLAECLTKVNEFDKLHYHANGQYIELLKAFDEMGVAEEITIFIGTFNRKDYPDDLLKYIASCIKYAELKIVDEDFNMEKFIVNKGNIEHIYF